MLTQFYKKFPIRRLAPLMRVPAQSWHPAAAANVRCLSITSAIKDSVVGATTRRIEKTKDEKFAVMLESMIKNEKWTMRPWKETLKDALSGWTMYIPGVSSSSEVTELKNMNAMLEAMTEEELDHPESIRLPAKERIAAASGKSLEDVSKMLHAFRQTLIVHTWLHVKKSKGEPLPITQSEMHHMQESDRRIRPIATKIMHANSGKMKAGGRGRRAF